MDDNSNIRDSKAELYLAHPRSNSPIYKFPIGTIVDDSEVIDYDYDNKRGGLIPVIKCTRCGRTKKIPFGCLRRHAGTSHTACGQYEKTVDKRFYTIWCSIKSRIYNKNYWKYDRYGGRGLSTDYDVFVDFYDDMYSSYIEHCKQYGVKNTKIDRINNDLGYVRGNLHWATQKEQVNNSTRMSKEFIAISPIGERFYGRNQTDFAKEHDLNPKQVNAVLSGRFRSTLGWTFQFTDSSARCND